MSSMIIESATCGLVIQRKNLLKLAANCCPNDILGFIGSAMNVLLKKLFRLRWAIQLWKIIEELIHFIQVAYDVFLVYGTKREQ